ncbi:MAG: cysteine synthase A [Gammaproteobacteria bacterium]|jgi:cysteine synthase A|nr:cysteine synthase A [Chromatiales bacterium]MDP6150718.1 cysteine synthase A [Gammaproteobacteria bacterium]MDP7094433.1 cysteine synthase A [Gammaproteobacteria bacterium]MDP7270178.1 cysteine synthase A [Gammaproteobacteria bacterium]MDP7418968.1 cysteine synthase A [Gammaproteobacteria bacterium]
MNNKPYPTLVDHIGQTPLIRLNHLSDKTGCEILGKAEFMNPGGSVKDRAALGIVRDAEAKGQLRAGGTIVEGTAGNTGIGLTMVGNSLGYPTVIVMPDNQSQDKVDTLRAYGADVRLVPAVPFKDPGHFVHESQRIAEEINASNPGSALWANQFDNVANRDFHEATTGPEIWEQTNGEVDGFICSVGTGGSLAGVARALRARTDKVSIGLSDPTGSALYNYFTTGELKAEGGSISEGIGTSRITENFADTPVDAPYQIPDSESVPLVFDLIRQEGLCCGGSTGVNVAGTVRLAKELGPGHVIVTLLCDSGLRYRERLFNREFLAGKGLEFPEWLNLDG